MINDEWSQAAASDISYQAQLAGAAWQMAAAAHEEVAIEKKRPSMMLRPKIYPDGDQWCCLLGDDLQMGVAGFGDTPELAAKNFDDVWTNGTLA
jgi:hypothetical protein